MAEMIMRRQVYVVGLDEAHSAQTIAMIRCGSFAARGFNDIQSLLRALQPEAAAVVVFCLDHLDATSSLAIQALNRCVDVNLAVIIVAASADIDAVVSVMKEGVVDIIEPSVDPLPLMTAVDEAFKKVWRLQRVRIEKVSNISKIKSLTPRERQIFTLRLEGLTSGEMGDVLGLSSRTVELHRANVMKKLNARTLVDLHKIADQLSEHGIPGLHLKNLQGRDPGASEFMELLRHRQTGRVIAAVGGGHHGDIRVRE